MKTYTRAHEELFSIMTQLKNLSLARFLTPGHECSLDSSWSAAAAAWLQCSETLTYSWNSVVVIISGDERGEVVLSGLCNVACRCFNVWMINVFKRFITCTTCMRAVRGSVICNTKEGKHTSEKHDHGPSHSMQRWPVIERHRERENSLKLFTLVILGAKIVAMLRAFILLEGSSSATSAMRFKAQSSSAASVEGSCFIRASVSFSPRHLSTASGLNSSNTPFGSSRNHVCHPHTQKINPSKFSVQKSSGNTKPSQKQTQEAQEMENLKKQDPI